MRIIFSVTMVFITLFSYSQKIASNDLPAAVSTAFNKQFKDLKKVTWEKEKNGNYEAEFDFNKKETSATFSPDGVLLEIETEIKVSELPEAVKTYISKNYPKHKISEASIIVDIAGAKRYEAEISKSGKHQDLIFNAQGEFVSLSDEL